MQCRHWLWEGEVAGEWLSQSSLNYFYILYLVSKSKVTVHNFFHDININSGQECTINSDLKTIIVRWHEIFVPSFDNKRTYNTQFHARIYYI